MTLNQTKAIERLANAADTEDQVFRLRLALMTGVPFLFGLLALLMGQDADWDFRNYHWYNAYAFLNGRFTIDFLPKLSLSCARQFGNLRNIPRG